MGMMKEGDNSFGVAALVFGVLSLILPLTFTGFLAGLVSGILAIIFGFVQKKKGSNSWANAGIILGIIGIVANVLIIWKLVVAINKVAEQLAQLQQSGGLSNTSGLGY